MMLSVLMSKASTLKTNQLTLKTLKTITLIAPKTNQCCKTD